ncbi:uncharacterized protein Z518_03341 [Rhinocladiella mackenziei CBS 650.93]|uniref:Uncharacterized protein n=1 Tax=Rhinocladiella mackenziei CBS 650.93 TaxID=1442369 RepID=A0A0D2IRR4_9EURO|nr:uncharacterized protein Z518_03341 [Rhinocladiella mackenziei CBS 650.93]KIX08684.1 hypothetical protein Z518_03341 [Rhinocladiella mackenziei CBS 650.93]
MAVLGWLDDSRNPTLWVIVVYPLLIVLLNIACQLKMDRLIQSLPLVVNDSTSTREEKSSAHRDSSAGYDMISKNFADNLLEEHLPQERPPGENLLADNVPEIQARSSKDASLQHKNIGQTAKDISHHHIQAEVIKGVLMHTLQVLLAHRLGFLATGLIRKTYHLTDKCIGLLAMSVVTFAFFMSVGFLIRARSVTLRGYRTNGGPKPPTDPSDPVAKFIVFSFLTLTVPWFMILFSFIK